MEKTIVLLENALVVVKRQLMQINAHVTLVVKFLPVTDCDDLVLSSMTLDESGEPLKEENGE
jgi:hypothetical protein